MSQSDDVAPDDGGCCVPEDEMLVVRDLNLSVPYKGGNQYGIICPDCGSRKFTAKAYWEMADPQYVIEKGDDEPKPLFGCPHEECDGELVGMVEECGECGGEIEWED